MQAILRDLCDYFGQSFSGQFQGKIMFDAIYPCSQEQSSAIDDQNEELLVKKSRAVRIGCCTNQEISSYITKLKYYKEDRYMTVNGFFCERRKEKYLFALHNIVIDIDCHSLPPDQINDLVEDFLHYLYRDLIDLNELPAPSLIVRTGRGVQLWFSLEQCSSKLLWIYKRVSKALILKLQSLLDEYPELLEGLEIDLAASGRAAGLYRVPGSYNTKTASFGTYETYNNRYNLAELYKKFSGAKDIVPDTHVYKIDLPKKPAPEFKGKDLPKGEYTLAHMRRMQLIEGLIHDRNKDAGDEKRNLMMLIYYNSCVQVMSRAAARQKLFVLNQKFKEQLNYRHIIDYIDTVKNIYNEEGYLPISNATLIKKLSINDEEQKKYRIASIHQYREELVQNATRDAKRKITKEMRNENIKELATKGKTIKEISESLKLNKRTVSSVLNNKESKAIKRATLKEKVLELRESGMTQKKIAETLEIALITVRRMC